MTYTQQHGMSSKRDSIGNIKEDILINAADISKKYRVEFSESSSVLQIKLEVKE